MQKRFLDFVDSEDLDSFFIGGQELLTKLQELGEAVWETIFNDLVLNGLLMRYESFAKRESFNPATNFTVLRKRPETLHESTSQGHKGQNDSLALAVKRDLRKGTALCAIPGHFAKDCRRKETAQSSKCGEEGQLDKATNRQWDWGKKN